MAYYFGALGNGKFEVFTSTKKPTEKSHGKKYKYVTGPYKNRGSAELAGMYQGVVVNSGVKKNQPTISKKIIMGALNRLNALYGRGDIIHVDWKNMKVYAKKQYGTDVVSFKVIGNTVYFRSHQMSLSGK